MLGRSGSSDVVAEDLGSERHRTGRRPGVGIEQQLGRVAPDPPRRVERAQRAEAVGLARADAVDEAVPDAGVVVLHRRPASPGPRRRRGTGRSRRRRSTPPRSWCPARTASRRAAHRRPGRTCNAAVSTALTTRPAPRRAASPPRGCRRRCPGRPRIRSATIPVHPVWWDAPSPAPLSPWKYSLKTRLSRQAGSRCSRSTPPKHGRSPSGPRSKRPISRRRRSSATSRASAAGRCRPGTRLAGPRRRSGRSAPGC